MSFLLRAFSLSHLGRHAGKVLLAVAGIAAGVATFSSMRAAERSLVTGLRATIDRVAGRAHLQVGGVGGVPESVEAGLRDLPEVGAVAPVIEQVATVGPGGVASVLLFGIDLLGDRQMREYGFEGQDTDLDDPVLFLAQPDSVAVSRAFADRHALVLDGPLTLLVGSDSRRFTVRAILDGRGFSSAFGGAVVVTDVYGAQLMLGRGRRFDRVDVRAAPDTTIDELEQAIRRALGPGYRIETPARRGRHLESLIANFTIGFGATALLALAIAVFLIFNTFTVAVEGRRREIGIMRAIGATSRQVLWLVLAEAAVLGLVGAATGLAVGRLLAGRFLDLMNAAVTTGYGVTAPPVVNFDAQLAATSMAVGLMASIAGAWLPARSASRVSPNEAIATGTLQATAPRITRSRLLVVVAAALLAAMLFSGPFVTSSTVIVLMVVAVGLITVVLIGPVANILLRAAVLPLAWLAPTSARLAVSALRNHPKRTAGTAAAVALSLGFALGIGGYLQSVELALTKWADTIMTDDLYVRASTGLASSPVRFPWDLADELERLPEVRRVGGLRNDRLLLGGSEVSLVAVDGEGTLDRLRNDMTRGTPETFEQVPRGDAACFVSDSLARRLGVGVGDRIAIDTPAGTVDLGVAAVVNVPFSDHGTLVLDRSLFARYWQDERVDLFGVAVTPGVDPGAARAAIQAHLSGRQPALVSSRAELWAELQGALDRFYALTRFTAAVALALAFVSIATALVVSVTERSHEIGIVRALGAVGRQIRRSVVVEALVVACCGLCLAIPVGLLLGVFLSTRGADAASGYRLPFAYPTGVLLWILALLPVTSAVAAWLPARRAAATRAAEALAHE